MNERLIKLMEYLEYTPSVFADEIGVIRSSISHIMSGRNKPGVELLQRVLKRFPEVSAEWLLAGIGPMFKEGMRTIVNQAPKRESIKEQAKPAEQTSLLGYIESIQQPEAQTKLEQISRTIASAATNNGTAQPQAKELKEPVQVSAKESKPEPEQPAAIELPKAKKEKGVAKIVVYYNDKTYQEFLSAED